MDAAEQALSRRSADDDENATSPTADAATTVLAETPTEPPAPRLVRRVACVYQSGVLPGEWLQTWRRLDRLFERSGLKVKALLTPLEDLATEDIDLVVAPPDLREAAAAVAGLDVPVIVTTPASAAIDFTDLVRGLVDGTELTAERIDPAAPTGPTIVTYRGSTRLD